MLTLAGGVQDDMTVLAVICTLVLAGAILLGARMVAKAIRGKSNE